MSALTQTVTWIPVGERLPKSGTKTFVEMSNGRVFTGDYTEGKYGGWLLNCSMGESINASVTHWMEVPKSSQQLTEEQNER